MEPEETVSVTETEYTPPVNSSVQLPPAPPQDAEKNIVGLIAMIVAIVGAVISLIPLIGVIGWVLLGVGLVLGVISLFLKGKKGFGIAAIVISVVASLVSGILFATSMAALNTSLEKDEVVVVTEETTDDKPTKDKANKSDAKKEAGEKADASKDKGSKGTDALGTRQDPIAIGTAFATDEWEVVINDVDMDATDLVLQESPYSDPPAEGNVYVLVDLTATYLGEDSSSTWDVDTTFVSDSGNTYKSYDANALAPEPRFGYDELYAGGSETGNLIFEIPADATGLLRVEPGFWADPIFVTTN